MKLKETITIDEVSHLPVGIFNVMSSQLSELLSTQDIINLDTMYYLTHSGEKNISILYHNLLKDRDNDAALTILSNIILGKYLDSWTKIYDALIDGEYNPLNNYKETKSILDNVSEENTKANTRNLNTSRNVKSNVDAKTSNSVYGFNSTNPVKTSNSESNTLTTEDITDNRGVESESNSGTDNRVLEGSKEITTEGYHDPVENIKKTLSLKLQYLYYDILMNNVDTIICSLIY